MTACYDCEQIGRKSTAERVVKGVQCCDFHYRQRMGIPMLANQRVPQAAAADPAPPAAAIVQKEKEGCPVEKQLGRLCACNCGERLRKDNTKAYKTGHQPKDGAHAIVSAPVRGLDRSDRVADMARALAGNNGNGLFIVKMSLAGMNALWLSLPADKKAELLSHLV